MQYFGSGHSCRCRLLVLFPYDSLPSTNESLSLARSTSRKPRRHVPCYGWEDGFIARSLRHKLVDVFMFFLERWEESYFLLLKNN